METRTAKAYLSRARELARFFCQPGVIDHAGSDYDDFVSEMVFKAWTAWRYHGRTRGYGMRSEKPYVLRAMRNRAKDLIRGAAGEGWDSLLEEPLDECSLHRQVEARLKLARLNRYLRGWQREILAAVASGESGAAYAASRGWHHSRLATARRHAAKIIGAD
jgi:DNA-directed RNA polymerase specialized sigma24 family protein